MQENEDEIKLAHNIRIGATNSGWFHTETSLHPQLHRPTTPRRTKNKKRIFDCLPELYPPTQPQPYDDTPEYVCNCTRGIQWSRDQRGIESWTAYLIELRNCGMPPFSPSPLQLFSVMVWYKPGRVAEIFCSAIYPRAFFLGGVFFFARFFGWSCGPGNPSTDTSHNAHQSPKPPLHAWQHKVLLQPRRKINKTPMTTSRTFFRSYFVAHNKAANKLSNVTNYQNLMWIQFILMLYIFFKRVLMLCITGF